MLLYQEGLRRAGMEWSDNYAKQIRFYSLQQIAEKAVQRMPADDFAECGCWKGHSTFILSKILMDNGFGGEFHIFDSFEGGLSEKCSEDRNLRVDQDQKQLTKESEVFSSTENEVAACLKDFPFVKLYKGWIPERFGEVSDRTFSFVHIDVDLYEPTMESLRFFYPRLVNNGFIVVDDYGLCQFPGAKTAVDSFLKNHGHRLFYEVPMGGCFIFK